MQTRMNIIIVLATLFTMSVYFGLQAFGQADSHVQPAGGYITGVVSSSDRAVSSVLVVISQGGSERGRSLTGDDGRYYIGSLGNGDYFLVATKGSRRVSRPVQLPQDQVCDIDDF